MKLNILFHELDQLLKAMGARQTSWQSDVKTTKLETDWKITLKTVGVEVDINDVEIMPNGLLRWNGEQILLHIKEVNGISLPKFHFYQCRTLDNMKKAGRLDRYVATQRRDGTFLVDRKVGYNEYKRNQVENLLVCLNCLEWYNRNYLKNHKVNDFSISDFFENFTNTPIIHKPTYTDTTAPPPGYTDDWKDIALRHKERCHWTCQQCGGNFKNKDGLHVHHINGVKSDNRDSNLRVLCASCHAEQPNHQHMKRNI
jgi:hypothetical protein